MMKIKRKLSIILSSVMILSVTTISEAAVPLMENVTEEMTDPAYWYSKTEDPNEVLATPEEIESVNHDIIEAPRTGVSDLHNAAEYVDGNVLNQQLQSSAESDIDYFMSMASTMYTDGGVPLTRDMFDPVIANTQNPSPESQHAAQYGIVTTRTTLRSLPTEMMILDEQYDFNFDYLYFSAINVNEPVIIRSVSADGLYYYAVGSSLGGWIKAEDVAICKDKQEWLDAWDIAPDKVLVVYGDKVTTEETRVGDEVSKRVLCVGTTLELADESDWGRVITNRSPYYNHVVWMPVRNDDGSYSKSLCLIPLQTKTCEGYLALTPKNLAKVAFNMLGNGYGWGGMLSSNDCSGYVQDIYRCFGLRLARNTTGQAAQPVKKYDVSDFSIEDKEKLLSHLPIGSVLIWSGHEMLYLGSENGKYYVINAVSSVMRPDGQGTRVRNVIINTVDIKRGNGQSWLETISVMEIPYYGFGSAGYDHDYMADDEDDPDDGKDDPDKKDDEQDDKKDDKKDGDSDKSKDDSKTKYSEEWIKGQWYDKDGKTEYKPVGSWKNNEKGWWYEDTSGWYPVSKWQKIDGEWYYFDDKGYMASEEWRENYWLDADGAWRYKAVGAWSKDSKGWWYGDSSGWYAKSEWQKIDGEWYYFKSSGYLKE